MKKIAFVGSMLSLGAFAWAGGVRAAEIPPDLLCQSYYLGWEIRFSRDPQYGSLQVTGILTENGVPSTVGFSFPAAILTSQIVGFTVKSGLMNVDGSVDTFSIGGARAHLSVAHLTDYGTPTLSGPVNEDLFCRSL